MSEEGIAVPAGYAGKITDEKELVFSEDEYKERLDRIRKVMLREKIDLIYVGLPESIYYISGYQSYWYQAHGPKSWFPISGIAVHVDHDKFILFEDNAHALMIQKQTVATDTRYFDYVDPESARGSDWVASELKSEGWLKGTVGLEMWGYRPHRALSEMLQSSFEGAGCKVVDCTDIVREVRAVKSPQEIAYIEKAAEIADIGLTAVAGYIKPGVTGLDIYGELVNAMAKAGGEVSGLTPGVLIGWQVLSPHSMASHNKLEPGDLAAVDPCGVYHRYHADNCRVFSMGEPEPGPAFIGEFGEKAMEFVKGIIRPNLPVAEFNDKIRAFYEEAGMIDQGYFIGGYEMGIAFPPDWVGPFFYDVNIDAGDAVFSPGTVVQFENGLGIVDTIVFTETEAKLLSKLPYGLFIIE
jgi:Xaa-Pro aminopeptidase